jgi:hypothetical protein
MSTYKNAQQQAQQISTAIVARLTKNHFVMTDGVAQSLVSQGLSEAQLPLLASTCLAINVPPSLLRYNHNIPQVVRALKLVTQLGYRANEDFYVSIFKTDVPVLSEDGEPTDDKAKAPTVVVMMSAARLESNGKEDGRLNGVLPHVETSIIEDAERAREIFNQNFSGSTKVFEDAIVAEARLYLYHRKNGNPLGSGEPQIFYGFYVPNQTYNGAVQKNFLESGKPKENHEGPAIARKRAASKAWRAVTRNNYPQDDRPVDVRLAALMDTAQAKLTMAERIADSAGVTLELAIIDGDEIMARQQANDKRATAMTARAKLDDFNTLLMYGEDSSIDTATGEIMDNATAAAPKAPAPKSAPATNGKSEAAGKFHKQVSATFGGLDVAAARHWFIGQWTEECTPDNVRFSTNDMADNELETMTAELKKRVREVRAEYQRYAADLDAININELQEMSPEPA